MLSAFCVLICFVFVFIFSLSTGGPKSAFTACSIAQFLQRVNQLNYDRNQSGRTNLDQLVVLQHKILRTRCVAVKRTNQIPAIPTINNAHAIC